MLEDRPLLPLPCFAAARRALNPRHRRYLVLWIFGLLCVSKSVESFLQLCRDLTCPDTLPARGNCAARGADALLGRLLRSAQSSQFLAPAPGAGRPQERHPALQKESLPHDHCARRWSAWRSQPQPRGVSGGRAAGSALRVQVERLRVRELCPHCLAFGRTP